MAKDLTSSTIQRQNILNNDFALVEIEKAMGIKGVNFEGKVFFTKDMLTILVPTLMSVPK
ncbi:MAG: hypothetical protein UHX00_06675 [Caryophanon sp.]|nr:hypothetical protein [Caryophanon sp.]